MKSAYELAMERLSKTAPTVKITDNQKTFLLVDIMAIPNDHNFYELQNRNRRS